MADETLSAALALERGWQLHGALTPLGEGHINDTLLVTVDGTPRFVLQRISRGVFMDPSRVMANLTRVLAHVRSRAGDLVPALVPTVAGEPALVDDAGEWWRLWRYVAQGRSISRTTNPALCRAAGEAFGRFQRLLADLPGPPLVPAIPGFLELGGYLADFDATLEGHREGAAALAAACGGAAVIEAMGFIDAHRPLAARFPPQGDLIHGDCKLNNLLFARDEPDVLAVLDLDTVMPGHWAWDFGDLARSVLMSTTDRRTAETALAALTEGFALGSGRTPDPGTVIDAPVYVAFMLGIRFLTDHLNGDRYFRVPRRGANLERARDQFDLVRRLTTAVPGAPHLAPPASPGR